MYTADQELSLIRWKLFVAFEKNDMTHFFKVFLHKGQKQNFKNTTLLYMILCSSASW
jgi:hypothetical protein